MTCTGTVQVITHAGLTPLMCSEEAGHPGDHFDAIFSIRWPDGAKIGTCHLPPKDGSEQYE
jgi:hypothetical protein